jgi:recombination protein RecA
MRLGDSPVQREVPVISTGALSLDIALGVGGYPRGRIVEIYGPESSGKTTLTLHAIAECSRRPAAPPRSSTLNTPSTRTTPRSSA